ncbi:histidine phosphatase family protein [Fusobacterium sp.]|uniref:histidine phosphatase family protein n=1 Tax=Fusobacterium sp. TaxID=68766 RepID=UPI00396CAD30
MKIYFIRHGETLWNTMKIFQGTSNSPLTEKGKNQAIKLGKRLKDIPFSNFYSSPMGRTIETSNLVLNGRDIKIEFLDEFKEISVGKMEGVKREVFEKTYPKQYHDFFFNPGEYDPTKYDGETYENLIKRVEKGLKKITVKHNDNEIVAVVSHGVTLKAVFKIINNLSFEELGDCPVPKNTSLSIVDYKDGKYTVELFSDTSHLDGCE